jgi:glycine/D-amino acid oxidase-like deaminating enzyme/nitrite reductase/ring-hydroxylating ferredoxin subunit
MSHSLWHATVGKTSGFPRLKEEITVDAAVIGGGISGVMTAYALKRAGLRVALLERHTLGAGETGHTTAHLTALTDTPYEQLRSSFGRSAKLVWDAQMRAIDLIESAAAENKIECDFSRLSAFKYAPDKKHVAKLDHEFEALEKLGIQAERTKDVPLSHEAAYRVDNQGRFHPLKFIQGVAKRIQGDGSFVLEHSPAIDFGAGAIRTPHGGKVIADHFIYATHSPVEEFLRVHTKISPYQTYAVAIPYEGPLRGALFYDNLSPYHYIRDHGKHLIIGGADHATGTGANTEEAFDALYAWVRRNIDPQFTVEHQWTGEVFEPQDGLPYIGQRSPGHYFATGFSGTGMTFGAISSEILCDLVLDRENAFSELFTPGRLKGWSDFVRHNTKVAWHFAADRIQAESIDDVPLLGRGEGTVIRHEGSLVAVSRNDDGSLESVSALCTHAACIVHWNKSDKTWDCPCHGSRFHADGSVRAGPAVDALSAVELQPPAGEPKAGTAESSAEQRE